jgi:hypothetical protein
MMDLDRLLCFCTVIIVALSGCAGPKTNKPVIWETWLDRAISADAMTTQRANGVATFDPKVLSASFRKIAFNSEKDPFGGGTQTGAQDEFLRKWTKPIDWILLGPRAQVRRAEPEIERFLQVLRNLTGHPIRPAPGGAEASGAQADPDRRNIVILYGDGAYFRRIAEGKGNVNAKVRDVVRRWYASLSPCGASAGHVTKDGRDTGELGVALVMIRHEVPDLLLRACIEEELSQMMGLFNDDPTVSPSIFNDDQSFALLTEHDADLLRILYDPRLKGGMSPEEAMPIVENIVGGL